MWFSLINEGLVLQTPEGIFTKVLLGSPHLSLSLALSNHIQLMMWFVQFDYRPAPGCQFKRWIARANYWINHYPVGNYVRIRQTNCVILWIACSRLLVSVNERKKRASKKRPENPPHLLYPVLSRLFAHFFDLFSPPSWTLERATLWIEICPVNGAIHLFNNWGQF